MIEFSLVDVKEISSNALRSQFEEDRINNLADSILESGGLLRPLILKQVSIDEFQVVKGHLEYYAAVRAREKDARAAEMVRAFVIPIKADDDVISKAESQIQKLSQTDFTKPTKEEPSSDTSAWISSFETRLSQMQEEFGVKQRETSARLKKLEEINLDESKDPLSLFNSLDQKEMALRLKRSLRSSRAKPEELAKLICDSRKKQLNGVFSGYKEIVKCVNGLGAEGLLSVIDAWSSR